MSYPLDPQISQYIIDCKLFKRFLPPQLRVDPLNELTGCTFLCLNVYEMYILLSYIKLNFNIFEDINFDNFSEIIQYNDKLYFVVAFNFLDGWFVPKYIMYISKPSKTFLIKKIIIKGLKTIFSAIGFNKKRSETTKLTIFDISI